MKLRFIVSILMVLVLVFPLTTCGDGKTIYVTDKGRRIKTIDIEKLTVIKNPDWSKTVPLAFLDTLKKHPVSICEVVGAPEDWIKEEHIPQLMQLIDSREPAAPVFSAFSSFIPEEPSTVGNEAMFLVEGFRSGYYPTALSSLYYFNGNPDEFRKWWSAWKTLGVRPAKDEAIKKMGEILDKADPQLVREINEILDKTGSDGFFYNPTWSTSHEQQVAAFLERKEIQSLIEKSDVSVPLMLKRIARNQDMYGGLSYSRFLVFGEVKSAESIPFLIDWLIRLSEHHSMMLKYVIGAIMKITGKDMPADDFKSLFDQRYEIAKQAKEWYDNYKKTHP